MRLAVFSDVHGNLPALDAVLADISDRRVDSVYCLGDLVGYGAFPNEAVERIRAAAIPTIMGNYDDGVGFERDDCGCAYREERERALGRQSLEWTKSHTSPGSRAFLRSLPGQLRFEADGRRYLLVHGSPRKLNEYLFEDRSVSSFRHIAESSNADVILFGHTHRPYVKTVEEVTFINVGSAGKPKDGDWRACYALLETADPTAVAFVRVPYDVKAIAEAIRSSNLPDEFALDLEAGWSG